MSLDTETIEQKPEAPNLGQLFKDFRQQNGLAIGKALVLAPQNDPLNLDKPANHALGKWFAEWAYAIGEGRHLRAYFYALIGKQWPDGKQFVNDFKGWTKLLKASKFARWLKDPETGKRYLPFNAVIDERNEKPVVSIQPVVLPLNPRVMSSALQIDVPEEPPSFDAFISMQDWVVLQPYRLVFWGEKTSLNEILEPLVERYRADLYLSTGEISDTQIYMMAKTGNDDGRIMVVFTFSDCDPSGYQMPTSIAHKLRLLQMTEFPNLRFRVVPVGITPEQVKTWRTADGKQLPSTPLKANEKRAKGWFKKHGVQQTEIDAAIVLMPDKLRKLAVDAIECWYDKTLSKRVRDARSSWWLKASRKVEEAVEAAGLDELRDEAKAAYQAAIESAQTSNDLVDQYDEAVGDLEIDWPQIELPEPVIREEPPVLISSDMDLSEHVAVLRDRKDYGGRP
jgi:hypothetical protein